MAFVLAETHLRQCRRDWPVSNAAKSSSWGPWETLGPSVLPENTMPGIALQRQLDLWKLLTQTPKNPGRLLPLTSGFIGFLYGPAHAYDTPPGFNYTPSLPPAPPTSLPNFSPTPDAIL